MAQSLATSGLRFTRHRQHIFDVVSGSKDHPTAEDIFLRAKKAAPEISFATVYNCLSVLVQCGLVRQVILDRNPTRFCPNMREHCHFYCDSCGHVMDIESPATPPVQSFEVPAGFKIAHYDLSLRGTCPSCSLKHQAAD